VAKDTLKKSAMMGAALSCAKHRTALLVDGFISMISFLYAVKLYPGYIKEFRECAFFSHSSAEKGLTIAMEEIEKALNVPQGSKNPLLQLELRLGEG
jgi:nicotinate-nucleotide--dimethylbenzimidazole phosphoribosyltransferase